MMILYDKHTGRKEIIYAVLDDDNGYPKFLIRNGNQWIYRSAKHYITKDERGIARPKQDDDIDDYEFKRCMR
jgi:hypothetical protein